MIGDRKIFGDDSGFDLFTAQLERLLLELAYSIREFLPIFHDYQRVAWQIFQQAGGRKY